MSFVNVTFPQPIELPVIGDIRLVIHKAYLNSKNAVTATIEVYNGSLCGLDTIALDENKARLTFSNALRRSGAIPDDPLAEGAMNDTLRDAAAQVSAKLLEISSHQSRADMGAPPPGDFVQNHKGLYYHSKDDSAEPFWVCSPIIVAAHTRDELGESWGRLLEIKDVENRIHKWAMPMRMLATDGRDYLGVLLDMGLLLSPSKSARGLLNYYIQTALAIQYARSVDRVGWYDNSAYILPDDVIGSTGEELVVWQNEERVRRMMRSYATRGSLEGWKENVAGLCAGNPILLFSVSTAFAGPLLALTGDENGGFHLRGPSSKGKSTATNAAGSVYGSRTFVNTWRATANGLEGIAVRHNDGLLVLDEIKQVDPKEAGEVAYMLANGMGKQRSDRLGGARERQEFRLLFLSNGEISLSDHMRRTGKRAHAGQEVRLIDIPAVLEAYGAFSNLHGSPDGAAFSRRLAAATQSHHGTALRAFLEELVEVEGGLEELKQRISKEREEFIAVVLPPDADGQVYRAAYRFSLVAVAGELATEWGVTGWEKGEADKAAMECFDRWLAARGGAQAMEELQAFSQVKIFIEQHGEDRFSPWEVDPAHRTYDRVGFRRQVSDRNEYYILPESFRSVICEGIDPQVAIKALRDRDWLKPDRDGKSTSVTRLPGQGRQRCFRIIPPEADEDSDE